MNQRLVWLGYVLPASASPSFIAIGQAVHLVLFLSYGWWAPALFSGVVS